VFLGDADGFARIMTDKRAVECDRNWIYCIELPLRSPDAQNRAVHKKIRPQGTICLFYGWENLTPAENNAWNHGSMGGEDIKTYSSE
jgi:hypothetical protein